MTRFHNGYEMRWMAGDPPMVPVAANDAPVSPRQVPLMILPPQSKPAPIRIKGHAALPGTGPAGETCGSCQHRASVMGGGKVFSKCALQRRQWTHGKASDIRRKDPACRMWQRKADA